MVQRQHSDEVKAQVLAALLAGQSVTQVARQFNVTRTTVRTWRTAAGLTSDSPLINHEKRAEIDDLVGSLLASIITTLRVQAEQFRDREWLAKQNAADLAVLFGVMADKGFRILEAADVSEAPDNGG